MQSQINQVIEKLGQVCSENHLSLVTAESCTAGGIAYHLSQHPSCSFLIERGFIVYSNASKENLLDVKPATIQIHGVVSEETAVEMAQGALKNSMAHVSVATTGIGGDDMEEGRHHKGVVWIACAHISMQPIAIKKEYTGNRKEFNEKVILESFTQLLSYVNKMK